jgi:hypothetical protein
VYLTGTGTAAVITPTINWGPLAAITYGTALGSGDLAATAMYSGNNISADGVFAYYVTSVGGTTATASTVLPGGSNTLCVQWTPSSEYSGEYNSASLCLPITVNALSTSISWTPASPIISPAPLGSAQFNASASSGATSVSSDGTFAYYINTVGGTVANSSTVLPVGSDQLCVQWTPSASYAADYNSSQLCQTITVNAPTSISWTPVSPITYPATLGSGQFNASASSGETTISADGVFAYYVTSVGGTVATTSTVLPGGSNTLCVQWTPSSSYSSQYNSASLCLPIMVTAASTSISWTPASPIISPAPLGSAQFNASASSGATNVSSDGTFAYYINTVGGTVANSSTVLPAGSNTVCVQWSPSSSYSADYNSSQLCQTITVNAPTSISWTPVSPITYPATLGSGQFNATAFSGATNVSSDGTFAYYITSVGGTVATNSTVLPGGSDSLCVQWTPSSSFTSQYSTASECLPITVNAASTSISWSPSSTTIIASTGPTAGQLDAAAFNSGEANITSDGTFTYYLGSVGGTVITIGSSLAAGPATICVQWAPSLSYAADYSSSSTCLSSFTVINTQPTTTTLASNANPVFLSNSITFTATVTPTSGSMVPTGSVTFYDGPTAIGTGTLSASGSGASAIARLTTTGTVCGSHAMTASYPGDINNQSSQTGAMPEVIEDFSIASTGSSSGTVEPGLAASFTFTVSPVSPATTFPAAIALTATGLPKGATYSFSPASIASGAGSTTVTLTVITPITTMARNQSPGQGARWPLLAVAILLLPLAGRFRRAGRRLSRMLSLLLLAAAGITAAAALNGCGGLSTGYFGQASSTSSIAVTGSSGALSHNASVSLTVE